MFFCGKKVVSNPLHTACIENDLEKVMEALQSSLRTGADINELGPDGFNGLHHAVKNKNIPIIKKLLEQSALHVAKSDAKDEYNALTLAIKGGDLDIVDMILEMPHTYTWMNIRYTPLVIAAAIGNTKMVERLIKSVEMTFHDTIMRNAIIIAAINGYTDIVKLLIPFAKRKINVISNTLYQAATYGHVDIIAACLDVSGVDVNAVYNEGTPLIQACRLGHLEVVKLLVACPELDVNLTTAESYSGLYYAVKYVVGNNIRDKATEVHFNIIKALLSTGKLIVDAKSIAAMKWGSSSYDVTSLLYYHI
jgi:ankyrin repeat protein